MAKMYREEQSFILETDKWIRDCSKHIHVCKNCDSVFEYRYNGGNWTVFKYSQLPKYGLPRVNVCQGCMDSTTPVEYY